MIARRLLTRQLCRRQPPILCIASQACAAAIAARPTPFREVRQNSTFTPPFLQRLPDTVSTILEKSRKGELVEGAAVTVHGWVRSVRKQKKIAFAQIMDGSSDQMIQLVFLDPSIALDLKTGVSVRATGKLEVTPTRQDPYEISITDPIEILGDYASPTDLYPLQKKFMTQEYLRREHPALRFRTRVNANVMRLRSVAITALSAYFLQNGFFQTQPPLITSSDCEGAGEVFTVANSSSSSSAGEHFFGQKAYLTVSTQLHLESLMMGLTRVWTLTPAFRAEESMTSRHLSEFWMLEAEVAFTKDLESVMSIVEGMIRSAVTRMKSEGVLDQILSLKRMLEKQKATAKEGEDDEEMVTADEVSERWNTLVATEQPWKRITYEQAISVLQDAVAQGKVEFQHKVEYGESLKSEHEKWLARHYAQGPVFVTNYPANMKPFYMLPGPDGTVECFDLLVPDMGELVGGSLREHDYERLRGAIAASGMDPEPLEWYLELRKWGSVPHGGFGMGFERLICYLGGVYNIREAIAFPRWIDHCAC
ncbi:hypothetical protein BZA70DRAFT_273358 [Myxozyma melibiosi]|uniref:asparagine--tRNA ligase n=1 Tax=Myxozyma melibiosi TaxID=54550 RepID=A0ABR1FEP2_9ASCO